MDILIKRIRTRLPGVILRICTVYKADNSPTRGKLTEAPLFAPFYASFSSCSQQRVSDNEYLPSARRRMGRRASERGSLRRTSETGRFAIRNKGKSQSRRRPRSSANVSMLALRAFARTCPEQYVTSCAYKGLSNDRKRFARVSGSGSTSRNVARGATTTGEYANALTCAVMSFAAMIKRLYNFQNQLRSFRRSSLPGGWGTYTLRECSRETSINYLLLAYRLSVARISQSVRDEKRMKKIKARNTARISLRIFLLINFVVAFVTSASARNKTIFMIRVR